MVHHDDNLALWIAIIIILFSLIINLGIANFVGDVVRGPNDIYPAKVPVVLTMQDLEEGVVLARGNVNVIVPDELVGKRHADVFKTIEDNVRFVENDYTKTFKQGKKIWVPDILKYQKDVRKYMIDGLYADWIVSNELKIKIFGKDHVVWVYMP